MPMQTTRVAFVTLARPTFDMAYAREIRQRSLTFLRQIAGVSVIAPEDVLVEPPDAHALGQKLAQDKPDLLIIQNGTFALGDLAVELAQAVSAPILLWAVPEPPLTGGALRSNSLVGMNVNASNLYKLGYHVRYILGAPEDPSVQASLSQACRVASAIRTLSQTRIGLVGSHAIGFFNLAVNQMELRKRFGVEVHTVGLQDAFASAASLSAEETRAALTELETLYPVRDEVTAESMEKMARQYGGLRRMATDNQLTALAVRCWPEWGAQYGIGACGSVSALNTAGITTGCEGDVDGTVTMILGRELSGMPSYLSDFITADTQDNTALFWHLGCAACQLAERPDRRALHSHFAGGKGITAGFTLKPGRITIARLGNDGHTYRLFVTTGEAVSTEMLVKGVLMKVHFDAPLPKLLDLIMENGIEHHYCVMYGDHREALLAFAAWKRIPVLAV